jgi:hypothetical protein
VCGLVLALSLTTSEARSDTATLAARVALLEQKVHGLEHRLDTLEKAASSKGEPRPGPEPDSQSSVGRFPVADEPCDPPFSVDPQGIRRIKPQCLEVGPCEPPFTVDADGRRRPKKECL